jgi:hypothetical protein
MLQHLACIVLGRTGYGNCNNVSGVIVVPRFERGNRMDP